MKKLITILFALLMLLPMAGCSKKEEAAEDGKTQIEYLMLNEAGSVDGWMAMVDEANKQLEADNIEIVVTKVNATGWPEYYQKAVSLMAGGNSADIGRIAESYMPTVIGKGQVKDITGYINSDFDQSQYYMKTFEGSNYVDGKYYGVPSGLYNYMLYYNKDLFDEAGIAYPSADWNNPTSFEEIADMAAALTKDTDSGKQFGFYTGPYMAEVGMFSTSLGGNNVFDANGNPTMNDATAKQVYAWFDQMLSAGTMPRPTDTTIMSSFDMFMNGKLAMTIDGTWMLGVMGGIEDFNVGLAAVPGAANGQAYSSQFVDQFVIYEGCKNPDAAWKAIKALVSQEGFEASSSMNVGGVPVQKTVADAFIENQLGGNIDAVSKQAAKDALDHVIKVPYNSYYQEADEKVNNTMDEWLLGQITSDEFAEKVQQIMLDYKAEAEKN